MSPQWIIVPVTQVGAEQRWSLSWSPLSNVFNCHGYKSQSATTVSLKWLRVIGSSIARLQFKTPTVLAQVEIKPILIGDWSGMRQCDEVEYPVTWWYNGHIVITSSYNQYFSFHRHSAFKLNDYAVAGGRRVRGVTAGVSAGMGDTGGQEEGTMFTQVSSQVWSASLAQGQKYFTTVALPLSPLITLDEGENIFQPACCLLISLLSL